MGVVYEALDTVLSRTVALKLIKPVSHQSPKAIARLEREARATAKLGHPNIVQVLDMGRVLDLEGSGAESAFLVMEQLTGETLEECLEREGPLEVDRAIRIHLQLLDALHTAHSQGVLHRDIKPSNIFLTRLAGGAELVKLLDFGLAYLLEEAASPKLTATGIALGTPAYMSPERITGSGIDGRADLYSVGISLYRTLTGRLPFQAESSVALRGRILVMEAPTVTSSRPELTQTVSDVVAMALAKKPEDRWATAREMADALGIASEVGKALQPKKDRVDRDAMTEGIQKVSALETSETERPPPATDTIRGHSNRPVAPLGGDTPDLEAEKVSQGTLPGFGGGQLAPVEHPAAENDLGDESQKPPTLALGGVTVPHAGAAPPVAVPRSFPAHKPRPWLAGVAFGIGLGALILVGAWVVAATQTPEPEPPTVATPPTFPDPTPEIERAPDPTPAPEVRTPSVLERPSLPTTSIDDLPPEEQASTRRRRRRSPRSPVIDVPTPQLVPRNNPPPRLEIGQPLEPDWGSPPR